MMRAARIVWVWIVTSVWLFAAACMFWHKPPATVEAPPEEGLRVGGPTMCEPSWPPQCEPRVHLAHPRFKA